MKFKGKCNTQIDLKLGISYLVVVKRVQSVQRIWGIKWFSSKNRPSLTSAVSGQELCVEKGLSVLNNEDTVGLVKNAFRYFREIREA